MAGSFYDNRRRKRLREVRVRQRTRVEARGGAVTMVTMNSGCVDLFLVLL